MRIAARRRHRPFVNPLIETMVGFASCGSDASSQAPGALDVPASGALERQCGHTPNGRDLSMFGRAFGDASRHVCLRHRLVSCIAPRSRPSAGAAH